MRAPEVERGAPGGFRDQQQRVDMWVNGDLMAGDLVGPVAGVFGLRGRQPVGRLDFPGRAARAPNQFALVACEVVVNPLQFASKMGRLALADSGKFAG